MAEQISARRSPTFAARHELARWIPEVNLGKGGRISSSAYMPGEGESHLSVNALELESLSTIAAQYAQYRDKFLGGSGRVAISCLKVADYTRASTAGGVVVNFHGPSRRWVFNDNGAVVDAFKHRPTPISPSHCGIETIRLMNEDGASKFARRLAGRPPGRNPHYI